jgi:HlyD family secretion protein
MSKASRRWLIVLLIAAALGAWGWWSTRPKPIELTLSRAESGTVEKTVSNTRAGTVTACRRAKLSPSTGGQIARLPITEGDAVKRGQLLLELWNDDIEAELLLATRETKALQATARSTCIKADEAQRNADRLKRLRKDRVVSEEDVDRAVSEARASRASCEAATATAEVREARVDVVRANLEKTRLIAPFDGVVAEINGELSEFVTPSPIGIATPPAVDLIDNTCFYVAAPIDEVDVAQVQVGQTARVTLDAFDQRRFPGQVRRIADYVLDLEKQARTVAVEVEFTDKEDLKSLLAGYSADVEIILDVRRDTLRIPTEAVLENDQVYVFLPDSGLVEKREIETGTSNWDHTEVLQGLSEGDWIVTSVEKEGLADGVSAKRAPDEGE